MWNSKPTQANPPPLAPRRRSFTADFLGDRFAGSEPSAEDPLSESTVMAVEVRRRAPSSAMPFALVGIAALAAVAIFATAVIMVF